MQYIAVGEIRPNPQQPRRQFSRESLNELAQSIREYGVLQPLTVRWVGGHYELVAGERRLRASCLAGLNRVPCLVARVEDRDAGLLALVENLHRRDLNCFEEAEAIAKLITRYDLSQSEAAEKLGKSQSAVANKLRLLRLPDDLRQELLSRDLTERHARALLRLSDGEMQRCALREMAERKMNVAQAEEYVDKLLQKMQTQPPQSRSTYILKDVRLFLNSVARQVELMKRSGVGAELGRQDTEETILLTIKIPKRVSK